MIADESDASINFIYLPFVEKSAIPKFRDIARYPRVEEGRSDQAIYPLADQVE